MNTLFQFHEETVLRQEHTEEQEDGTTIGETVAVLLLLFLVVTGIILGLWSGIALYTGAVETGGPIGILVDLVRNFLF